MSTYTDQQFLLAVQQSKSWRNVSRLLDIKYYGHSNATLKKKAQQLGVDYSHFTGQAHAKGTTHNRTPSFPLEQVLTEHSTYHRNALKKRLIKAQLLKNECALCQQPPIWNNQPLVMVLDHINGVRDDNRLDNLRLLCPNCNSQQPTFAGRNKGKYATPESNRENPRAERGESTNSSSGTH